MIGWGSDWVQVEITENTKSRRKQTVIQMPSNKAGLPTRQKSRGHCMSVGFSNLFNCWFAKELVSLKYKDRLCIICQCCGPVLQMDHVSVCSFTQSCNWQTKHYGLVYWLTKKWKSQFLRVSFINRQSRAPRYSVYYHLKEISLTFEKLAPVHKKVVFNQITTQTDRDTLGPGSKGQQVPNSAGAPTQNLNPAMPGNIKTKWPWN